MNYEKKFKQIELKHRIASITGVLLTLASLNYRVKNNKKLNTLLLLGGCCCSMTSFVTYVQSLEEYGLTKEIDELKILKDYIQNVIIFPSIDIMLMTDSLKDIINKQ